MRHVHNWFYKKMKSPLGELMLVANEKSLVAILWDDYRPRWMQSAKLEPNDAHPVLREAERQLQQYFDRQSPQFPQ